MFSNIFLECEIGWLNDQKSKNQHQEVRTTKKILERNLGVDFFKNNSFSGPILGFEEICGLNETENMKKWFVRNIHGR